VQSTVAFFDQHSVCEVLLYPSVLVLGPVIVDGIMAGELIRKPQIAFRERLTDKRLQARKFTQLRKGAHDQRLDVRGLTQKWQV
jgi:hypothetical protein